MTAISWAVEADFDRDGSYGTDLTGYVTNPGGTISWQRGLGKDGVYQVSRLGLSLNNSSGIFTVDNSASSLYGKIEPEVPLRVVATFAGAEYAAWTGYIKSWRHGWSAGQVAQCSIEAEDISAYLWQFAPVNVTDAQRTSGAAITAIFAAMGLTASDYDVATGAQTFPHHWVRNTDGMSAAMDVLRSEMGGQLYVDGDGKLVFEGRDGRLGLRQFDRLIQRYGPAAAWRFGEATGATVYDYSGNANHMTLTNSPARLASLSGAFSGSPWDGGTDFEAGSSQYGTVADHATLDVGDSFTYYYLFKLESLANEMVLSMKGTNNLTVSVKTNGEVSLDKAGVANIGDSSGAGIAADEWNMVVVTKAGATIKVYCNGADVSGSWSNATIENTADALSFGYYQPTGALYFDGIMARAGIFDRALTATEVLRLERSRTGNTWGDDTSIFPVSLAHEIDDTDLVSTASVQAQILVDSDPTQVVFGFSRNAETYGGRTADSILIPAGGQYGPFEMDYARPITSLSTPVAGQDYKANSLQNGRGTDLTSDLDVTVTDLGGGFRGLIRNTGATDAYITKFELQGIPADALVDRPQFTVTRSIAGNKTDLGVTILLSYADDDGRPPKAADYAWALASRYRWPYPRITMEFRPNTDTERAAFLGLELGALVYYKDIGLGVDQAANVVAGAGLKGWYYVESIRMAVPVNYAGQTFDVSATLIPSWLYRDLDRIVYDDFARDNASGDLGTSRSGDDWASDTGFDITSEKARANTDTESIATLDLGALAFDHVAETTLAAIGPGDEVGLAVRYIDANNHYRAYLDRGSNEVILEKVVGGVVTEIASPAYTVGTTAELRVMVQGKRFRVWVGRRLYIDSEDTALNTGTKAGLFARNANGTTTFDDFYAEAL